MQPNKLPIFGKMSGKCGVISTDETLGHSELFGINYHAYEDPCVAGSTESVNYCKKTRVIAHYIDIYLRGKLLKLLKPGGQRFKIIE